MLLSGAAVAGLAGASANAAMVVGLKAIGTYADTNFTNFQPLGGGDTPSSVAATPGKVISMGVFAQVTQTGAVGDPSAGGTGWPAFSSAGGRIVSSGGGVRANVFGNFLDGSVSGNGSSSGNFVDLDSDTDLDNGNTDANSANPAGWVLYRGATGSGEIGPGSNLLVGANTQSIYGNKPDGTPGTPTTIPGGFEYYLGEVDFVVTNATAPGTNVVWQFRPQTGNATWFENATRTVNSKNGLTTFTGGTTGTAFSSGPAVLIGGGGVVPEPATFGLAGLAGLSLLARRSKKN